MILWVVVIVSVKPLGSASHLFFDKQDIHLPSNSLSGVTFSSFHPISVHFFPTYVFYLKKSDF